MTLYRYDPFSGWVEGDIDLGEIVYARGYVDMSASKESADRIQEALNKERGVLSNPQESLQRKDEAGSKAARLYEKVKGT